MFFALALACSSTKILIFDAGSSSTRIYGYEYNDPSNPLSFVAMKDGSDAFYKKCEIRLADVASEPKLIDTIYNELLRDYADVLIPENERQDIRFMIYATAGMRLLTLEDQKKVMDIAYTTAKNNYKYSVKREDFKVIEGYQEGIYAWIGLNRLIETFGDEIKTLPHFEIGGASAQIASEVPKHTSDNLDKFIYDVQIGSNKYHIFAHSYLGYGGEQVSLTIHTKLLDQGKTETPCALRGTPYNITINGETKHFTGTGNFDECYSLLSTHVFKKSENGKCGAYDCVFYDEKANECVPLPLKFDTIYAQGVPAKSTDFLEMKNKTMYITE